MSGALFQTLLRNPLGSPDVIGFDAGGFCVVIPAPLARTPMIVPAFKND